MGYSCETSTNAVYIQHLLTTSVDFSFSYQVEMALLKHSSDRRRNYEACCSNIKLATNSDFDALKFFSLVFLSKEYLACDGNVL